MGKRQGILFLFCFLALLCAAGCGKEEEKGFGKLSIEKVETEQELSRITAVCCTKDRAYFAGSREDGIWIGSMGLDGKDQEWEKIEDLEGTVSDLATDGKGNFRLLLKVPKTEDGEYKTQFMAAEYQKGNGKIEKEAMPIAETGSAALDMEKEAATEDQQKFVVYHNGKKGTEIVSAVSFALDINGDTLALSAGNAIDLWNTETGKKAASFPVEISGGINHLFLSADEVYTVYLENSDGIYGCRKGACDLLFSWADSEILEKYLTCAGGVNGVFFAGVEGVLYRIAEDAAPSDQAGKDDSQIIVATLKKRDSMQEFINAFNSSQEEYHAKLVSYENYENPEQRLNIDIATGNAPDIIEVSENVGEKGMDQRPVDLLDVLDKKGALEDLRPYLEADPIIGAEDLMEKPLQLLETDGKLTRLAPVFYLCCAIGSRKVLGGRLTWNWEDYARICGQQPQKTVFSNFNHSGPVGTWLWSFQCSYRQYVDISAGEVHFQDGNFARHMGMLKELLEDRESVKSGVGFVWQYRMEGFELLDLEEYIGINDRNRYALEKNDLQFIGLPTDSGNGVALDFPSQFVVLASSDKKEGAWQLLSSLWKRAENLTYFEGFPMVKSEFEYKKACAMTEKEYKNKKGKYYYRDEQGNHCPYDYVYASMMPGYAITKRQMKNIMDIIELADTRYMPSGGRMFEIVYDLDDEKTAEEMAEELQSRIGLYISEQG